MISTLTFHRGCQGERGRGRERETKTDDDGDDDDDGNVDLGDDGGKNEDDD